MIAESPHNYERRLVPMIQKHSLVMGDGLRVKAHIIEGEVLMQAGHRCPG